MEGTGGSSLATAIDRKELQQRSKASKSAASIAVTAGSARAAVMQYGCCLEGRL
jgi:hypothetical protein